MIGIPFNDLRCLGSITEVIAELVTNRDPLIAELAEKHNTAESLADWIRTLPQRDDDGEAGDGPKVDACKPAQRLRIPAPDPNCVERAALYLAVAELIDPKAVRQLATLDTPIGLHTFPVENGAPVILDPRVPRNCLDCGVALVKQAPVAVEARDAIEWTAQLAEADIDLMGWLFAMAEQVARKYGTRALAIVRTTAQAIADLVDESLARSQRNIALEVGGMRLTPAPWVSALAKIAARVGLDVGAVALRTKLATLGIGPDMFGLVEEELNREGLTMGELAKPRRLPTIANFVSNKNAA